MIGALESEWSRNQGLEMFLFVSVALLWTHSEYQHYQLFASPVLLLLSSMHFEQNDLVCVLGSPKYFV